MLSIPLHIALLGAFLLISGAALATWTAAARHHRRAQADVAAELEALRVSEVDHVARERRLERILERQIKAGRKGHAQLMNALHDTQRALRDAKRAQGAAEHHAAGLSVRCAALEAQALALVAQRAAQLRPHTLAAQLRAGERHTVTLPGVLIRPAAEVAASWPALTVTPLRPQRLGRAGVLRVVE